MLEFNRLWEITMLTGETFTFQYYVIFVWAAMLPRSFGAGVHFCYQEQEPVRLEPRFVLIRLLVLTLFAWSIYEYGRGNAEWWTVFGASFLMVMTILSPLRIKLVRLLFYWTFYASHRRKLAFTIDWGARSVTVVITIFDEKSSVLHKCLGDIKKSLERAGVEFVLIAVVDGWGKFNHARVGANIAKQYCDVVLTSNAQNKRENLRALYTHALKYWSRRFPDPLRSADDIIFFLDSDTVLGHLDVAANLLRPFGDMRIGGVTTAQLVYQPETIAQYISFWFESARLFSSMPFLSLFGQVVCLPGRLYAVRATYLSSEIMDALVNDSFSYFGFFRAQCVAGDDRFITNQILRRGGRTILAPDAPVFTRAPEEYKDVRLQWRRWGRTSQGYTIRSPWLIFRYPVAAFVVWTDLGITFFTVFIVFVHWPYQLFFGESIVPFLEAFSTAINGMLLTMVVRQAPHLWKYPRHLGLLPFFAFIAMDGHVIRMRAFFTQHKVGDWLTRAGADTNRVKTPTFDVYYSKVVDIT